MNLAKIYAKLHGKFRFSKGNRTILIGYIIRKEKRLFWRKDVFLLAYYDGEQLHTHMFAFLMAYSDMEEGEIRSLPKEFNGRMLSKGQFAFKNAEDLALMLMHMERVIEETTGYSNPFIYASSPIDQESDSMLEYIRSRREQNESI